METHGRSPDGQVLTQSEVEGCVGWIYVGRLPCWPCPHPHPQGVGPLHVTTGLQHGCELVVPVLPGEDGWR